LSLKNAMATLNSHPRGSSFKTGKDRRWDLRSGLIG
jgi:hypothetical protein